MVRRIQCKLRMLHLEEKLNADCLQDIAHDLIGGTQFFFKKFWNKRVCWQQISSLLCHDCRLLLSLEGGGGVFCFFGFFLLPRKEESKNSMQCARLRSGRTELLCCSICAQPELCIFLVLDWQRAVFISVPEIASLGPTTLLYVGLRPAWGPDLCAETWRALRLLGAAAMVLLDCRVCEQL